MSELGLYSGHYEQLRSYADRLDRALVGVRNHQADVALRARRELVAILREFANRDSQKPSSHLVATVLRQELGTSAGGPAPLAALAKILEQRSPNQAEVVQLEQIALALDKECSSTLARMRGLA